MKKYASYFAAALIAGLITVLSPLQANAGPVAALTALAVPFAVADTVQLAGYYGPYAGERDDEGGYDDEDRGYDGHGERYCSTHYVKKYVCDQTEPRCFRQRECVWYYGREYCRNVRKCVGGEKYCKWVSVPVEDCGYDR